MKCLGGDGQSLCGWERGTGAQRVVLLHGVGDHARIWDPVTAALADGARTLALDLRGHGDSAWSPDRSYAREAFFRDLERVMRDLGEPETVLVGHSLGGSLALEYASRYPESVSRLVLVDVGPELGAPAVRRLRQGLRDQLPVFADVAAYRAHLAARYWLADPEALGEFARHGARPGPGGVIPKLDPAAVGVLEDRDAGRDVWAELGRVRCPTLVLRATGSAVLARATAQKMVEEALALGSLEEVPRSGHALLLDNPGDAADRIRRFLLPHHEV